MHSRKAILAFCRLAHRTLSGADFLPYLAKPTVGSLGAVGAPDTVRCTPDSPVLQTELGLGSTQPSPFSFSLFFFFLFLTLRQIY